jgi:hypothetical protein
MPTILNNACVNRVLKVLKIKLTSNDLSGLIPNPFPFLPFKTGNQFVSLKFVDVLVPEGHGYVGTVRISGVQSSFITNISYVDSNTDPNLQFDFKFGTSGFYELSVDEDFFIGVVRPDIELHIYYTLESATVSYDVGVTEYVED